MTALRFSEAYQPTGSLAAIGVLNQLGRPDIEPLEVLVRESVQNCWDAKRDDTRHVVVDIGRRKLDDAETARVRRELFVLSPPGLPLDEILRRPIRLLYFADFQTRGLGGPTRADRDGGGIRDFVDFVRNIGQPPDNASEEAPSATARRRSTSRAAHERSWSTRYARHPTARPSAASWLRPRRKLHRERHTPTPDAIGGGVSRMVSPSPC